MKLRKLLRKPAQSLARALGCRMLSRAEWTLIERSRSTPYCPEFLDRLDVDPRVIFDVGANVGDVSACLAGSFPSAKVYAFEPSSTLFPTLEQRFQHRDNVACFNLALTNTKGNIGFVDMGNQISHIASPNESGTLVACTTCDTFMKDHRIRKIDILKIDTEGHDLTVLLGAQNALTASSFGIIVVEYGFGGQKNTLHEVIDFLRPFEYGLLLTFEEHYFENGFPHHCNAVFANLLSIATCKDLYNIEHP